MHDLTVSVADILGSPGAYRDVQIAELLPGGLSTALARLDDLVHARLRLESVVEGVLVTGEVSSDVTYQCARCLRELPSGVRLQVCELWHGPGRADGEDEGYRLAGTELDLEPMLRDALVLALPLNPVCSEDCKGLCARCGRDLNLGSCDCTDDEVDPRWAALDALKERA